MARFALLYDRSGIIRGLIRWRAVLGWGGGCFRSQVPAPVNDDGYQHKCEPAVIIPWQGGKEHGVGVYIHVGSTQSFFDHG